MNLDDLKEQIKEKWQEFQDQLEESTTYHNIREKYMELPIYGQKALVLGLIGLGILLVLFTPISYMSSSNEVMESYETRRGLIYDLFKYGRTSPSQSIIPQGEEAAYLVETFRSALKPFQLLPEQVVAVEEISIDGLGAPLVKPPIIQSNFKVELKWLNLQQIVEIGVKLQSLRPHVKMLGLDLREDMEKNHYYTAIYKFAGLSLPVAEKEKLQEEDEEKSKRKRKRKRRRRRKES